MKSDQQSLPIIGLITAEFLSLLGNQVAAVAIPILVLQFTQSPLATGIASAGNSLPIVWAAIWGGTAIDRFGAWKISIMADLLSFASVLALPLVFLYVDGVSPALIFLLVLLGALFDPTAIAARQTLVSSVTELSGQSLPTINSWRGGLENGADFIGPVVGVGLIGLVGSVNAFLMNAVTFLLCALIVAITVPNRTAPAIATEQTQWAGIQFIVRHPQLRALAISGMVANFVILPFLGLLLPVVATQTFGSNLLLGICLSVFGLAATLGATAFSRLSRRLSRSGIYYGGLLMTGTAIACCAIVTHPYQLIGSAAVAGLLLGAGNPLEQTILQEDAPEAIAGQVFTSMTAIHFVAGPLGLLLSGIMTEVLSVESVLLSGGGLLMALAIVGWQRLPLVQHHPTHRL